MVIFLTKSGDTQQRAQGADEILAWIALYDSAFSKGVKNAADNEAIFHAFVNAPVLSSQGLKIIAGFPSSEREGREPEQDHGKMLFASQQSVKYQYGGSR
jgi:hypothetical protein